MTQSLSDIRRDYGAKPLNKADLSENPMDAFSAWLQQATESELLDPTAFVLSTVDSQNNPDSRILLLKGIVNQECVFYSNNQSVKALQLKHNPNAVMNFYWAPWSRQVRIKGKVSLLSREESVAYFNSRPKGSQISAVVSQQSQSIPNREYLEAKVQELNEFYKNSDIPCPEHWQGYSLAPYAFEFFQGRDDRLHDRFRYQLIDNAWQIQRLSP